MGDYAVAEYVHILAGLNFRKFLCDLVSYCLQTMRLQWDKPVIQRHTVEFFRNDIGDAVLRYRNGHDEKFRLRIRSGQPLEDIETFVRVYVRQHFDKHESKNVPLQLFVFCAFLVDLAVFCCRSRRPDLVLEALDASERVHDDYISLHGMNMIWKNFMRIVRQKGQFDAQRDDNSPTPSTSMSDEERSRHEAEARESEEQLLRSLGKLDTKDTPPHSE